MPKPYSLDLRERVVTQIDNGMEFKEAAKIFNLGLSTVKRWFIRYKAGLDLKPISNYHKGHSHKLQDDEILHKIVREYPDKTSREYAQIIGDISPRTVRKKLKLLGYSRKKRPFHFQRDPKIFG